MQQKSYGQLFSQYRFGPTYNCFSFTSIMYNKKPSNNKLKNLIKRKIRRERDLLR